MFHLDILLTKIQQGVISSFSVARPRIWLGVPVSGDLTPSSCVGGDAGALVEEGGVALLGAESEGEGAVVGEGEAGEDKVPGGTVRPTKRHHPLQCLQPLVLKRRICQTFRLW